MSDTMTLRDHSKPCEHGYNGSHDDGFAPSGAVDSEQDTDDGWCPGGKEITLRRPQRYWHEGTDVDGDTSTWFVPVSSFDAKVWVEADDE